MIDKKEVFVDGLKINYQVLGEGRPLLILHGWGSKAEKWQKTGELLAENGLMVVIPDLPGCGTSQEPDFAWDLNNYYNFVEKFIDQLNLKNIYLLGHSFGGGLAVKYTLKSPQNIKKLFLVASAVIRKKTFKKKVLTKISKIFKIFSFLPFYSLFKKAFYKFVVKKSDYPSTSGIMREIYLKMINEDLSGVLELIKVPTVIIWGDRDDVVPIENSYLINKKINNSKLVIIPGGDHDLEQKMPELLAKKILENLPH